MISSSSSSAMEAMQQEGETSTHDKAKRRLKSPSQVEALENFFREHKYPSEAMKLQFAMKIGLSEKQVSGWFCHRRLKEKKTIQTDLDTNGKQNLSNSAFHDHINEIKQESCSSSKNVDKNAESKEAESRMHHGYNKPSSSSCSSSASHGRYSQINENLCVAEVKSLQCKLWDYGSTMTSSRSSVTKSREHMAHFGHSFVHDEGDSVAIFEIKGKLGRHFREDGPPMGFDFDSLPPGAFHSPALDSKCGEPYYIGNFMKCKSSSFYRSINSPGVQDKYNIEKLASRVYQEQRSFQRANSGSIEYNETANLHTNMYIETTKSMNQIFNFKDEINLRCSQHKTDRGYDSKLGYNFLQIRRNSDSNKSKFYPDHDAQAREDLDTKPFISSHQPQKLLKASWKVNCGTTWQQKCADISREKPALVSPSFFRNSWELESNLHHDLLEQSSSSLD